MRLGLLVAILGSTAICVSPALSTQETEHPVYELREDWSIGREAIQNFALETRYFIPDDLVGASVDDDGTVYICDKLTEMIYRIADGGKPTVAVGSVGDGPEDHAGSGEPIPLGSSRYAWADCSVTPKVIVYQDDGRFLSSHAPDISGQLVRMFWNGTNCIAVAFRNRFFPGGTVEFTTHMFLLDGNGAVLRSRELRKEEVRRGDRRLEQDMWNVPRVSASDDGFCFVQRDLYNGVIECYDKNLDLIRSFDGGWRPTRRTAEELESAASMQFSGLTFCEFNHSVRRMIARRAGEVWVQPWTEKVIGGEVRLQRFGRDGERLDDVRLVGLPRTPGDWIVRGEKLLWIARDDEDADERGTPYIVVFDLVRQ